MGLKGYKHTKEAKKKIGAFNKGKKYSPETLKKMSMAKKGKKLSEEHRKKLSKGHKGQKAWNRGISINDETQKALINSHLGKPSWNKGNIGMCTKETILKMRNSHLGYIPGNKGIKYSIESKRKMRISRIIQINKSIASGGQIHPTYNKLACEYFKQFDEINNIQGQYATSGGEYYIKELGYWLDYFCLDKKLIIEWDEEAHYINGKLKERDIIRQKEIENHFPDYTFIRIREAEYIPKANELFPKLDVYSKTGGI